MAKLLRHIDLQNFKICGHGVGNPPPASVLATAFV